jgi:serine O-acetyltransferase
MSARRNETWSELRRGTAADIRVYANNAADFQGHVPGIVRKASILLTPPLLCATTYRLSHWLWCRNFRGAARLLAWMNLVVNKAMITPDSSIGAGVYIPHTAGIFFEGDAGDGLALYANAVVAGRPSLGDNVSVAAHAMVLGAISVGSSTKIGPRVALTRDLPANTVIFVASPVA